MYGGSSSSSNLPVCKLLLSQYSISCPKSYMHRQNFIEIRLQSVVIRAKSHAHTDPTEFAILPAATMTLLYDENLCEHKNVGT